MNEWGELPALPHKNTREKIPHKEREGSPDSMYVQTLKSAAMEGASGKMNPSVVGRIYDRWSGLCCGATAETTTVYLRADQGTVKFNHQCPVSTP
jgi:hypothetical protein